jgi:hypothetical protein
LGILKNKKSTLYQQIKTQMELTFNDSLGDVFFYQNAKGKLYQQLGSGYIFPIKNGKHTYKTIAQRKGFIIKYDNNGIHGFIVFKGKRQLEDGIWKFADAQRICDELAPKKKEKV